MADSNSFYGCPECGFIIPANELFEKLVFIQEIVKTKWGGSPKNLFIISESTEQKVYEPDFDNGVNLACFQCNESVTYFKLNSKEKEVLEMVDYEEKEVSKYPAAFKFEKEGDFVAGTYFMKEEGLGKDKKSTLYYLRQEDGSEKIFWGTHVLNDKMSLVKEGENIKVVYKGKFKSAKGGREFHDFSIHKAKEEKPAVAKA